MKNLNQTTDNITTVVEIINNIVGKTNLLALNTTIAAASTGKSREDFVVAAGEVKELARETTKTMGEISETILSMQLATRKALEMISAIPDHMENTRTPSVSKINKEQLYADKTLAKHFTDTVNSDKDLDKTQYISDCIADKIAEISRASQNLAHQSYSVVNHTLQMSNLVNSTTQSSDPMQQETLVLTHMAEELASSVQQFTL